MSQVVPGVLSTGRIYGNLGVSALQGQALVATSVVGSDVALGWEDVALAAHVHEAEDITSVTFPDARISETSVTQHEDALTITTSQISDIASLSFDLVEDTTPQLGGNLDMNGFSIQGVTAEEMARLSGVNNAVQTQFDNLDESADILTAWFENQLV